MFDLNDQQKETRAWARAFAEKEVQPRAAAMDRDGVYDRAIIDAMFEAGLMGLLIPEEYGGRDLSALEYVTAVEELARCDASTALVMSIHSSLVTALIAGFASDEMKRVVLPGLASGKIGAFALTEEDPTSPTRAGASDDTFVARGTKMYITNGPIADYIVLFAVTGVTESERDGKVTKRDEISALLVDADHASGLERANIEGRMGLRAAPVGRLAFGDVTVQSSHLVGERGAGFRMAMKVLDAGRIGAAAMAVGVGQAALEAARSYATSRVTQGRPIAQFQAVQMMVAEAATRLEAARALTYQAAASHDRGEPISELAAMAKLFASEAASFVASRALQVHGGSGVVSGLHPVERYFRDARVLEIIEGTSEIQKLIVAGHELRS
ncbi:MAG: acyl-CoA dehydrogenase family protein [Candidatus Eisenbacteria bacterium]|nr:acyl-CoA dehydrogenase family protein [Candidatus Eisenbacteria bacterium]